MKVIDRGDYKVYHFLDDGPYNYQAHHPKN